MLQFTEYFQCSESVHICTDIESSVTCCQCCPKYWAWVLK